MEAIRLLREAGLPVHVRIDPLFPRISLSHGKTAHFGLPYVQSLPDLEALICFCREAGVRSIVYSVADITQPRLGGLSGVMQRMKLVYEHLAPENGSSFGACVAAAGRRCPSNSSSPRSWTCAVGTPSSQGRARPI